METAKHAAYAVPVTEGIRRLDRMNTDIISGVMIPFIGTSLGAACVFFMKREFKATVQKALSGFAAGAMMYVVVEELIPEMSEGEHSNVGTLFFAFGFTLMMALDVALG